MERVIGGDGGRETAARLSILSVGGGTRLQSPALWRAQSLIKKSREELREDFVVPCNLRSLMLMERVPSGTQTF